MRNLNNLNLGHFIPRQTLWIWGGIGALGVAACSIIVSNLSVLFNWMKVFSPGAIPVANNMIASRALEESNPELLSFSAAVSSLLEKVPYVGDKLTINIPPEKLLSNIENDNFIMAQVLVTHGNIEDSKAQEALETILSKSQHQNYKASLDYIALLLIKKEVNLFNQGKNRETSFYAIIQGGKKELIEAALTHVNKEMLKFASNAQGNNIFHFYASSPDLKEIMDNMKIEFSQRLLSQPNHGLKYPLDSLMFYLERIKPQYQESLYLNKVVLEKIKDIEKFIDSEAQSSDFNAIFKTILGKIDELKNAQYKAGAQFEVEPQELISAYEKIAEKLLDKIDYIKQDRSHNLPLDYALKSGSDQLIKDVIEKTSVDFIENKHFVDALSAKKGEIAAELLDIYRSQKGDQEYYNLLYHPLRQGKGTILNLMAENIEYYDSHLFQEAYRILTDAQIYPLEQQGDSKMNVLHAAIICHNDQVVEHVARIITQEGMNLHMGMLYARGGEVINAITANSYQKLFLSALSNAGYQITTQNTQSNVQGQERSVKNLISRLSMENLDHVPSNQDKTTVHSPGTFYENHITEESALSNSERFSEDRVGRTHFNQVKDHHADQSQSFVVKRAKSITPTYKKGSEEFQENPLDSNYENIQTVVKQKSMMINTQLEHNLQEILASPVSSTSPMSPTSPENQGVGWQSLRNSLMKSKSATLIKKEDLIKQQILEQQAKGQPPVIKITAMDCSYKTEGMAEGIQVQYISLGYLGINIVESKEQIGYWLLGTGYESYFLDYQPLWIGAYYGFSVLVFHAAQPNIPQSELLKNAGLVTGVYTARKTLSSTYLNQDYEYTPP